MNQYFSLVTDIPRWVETRALLLNGRGKVFGQPPDFLVRHTVLPFGVVGTPELSLFMRRYI
jgi:hypothetical protein